MKKFIYLLLIVLIVMTIFIGCESANNSSIGSEEEASKAVSNLGEDIGGAGATLDDIDNGLSEKS